MFRALRQALRTPRSVRQSLASRSSQPSGRDRQVRRQSQRKGIHVMWTERWGQGNRDEVGPALNEAVACGNSTREVIDPAWSELSTLVHSRITSSSLFQECPLLPSLVHLWDSPKIPILLCHNPSERLQEPIIALRIQCNTLSMENKAKIALPLINLTSSCPP